MARQESPREDLIAEATALIDRIEFTQQDGDLIFVGFKRSGGLSIYFGEDPVYQFDDQSRLRRAFKSDLMYRSQGTTLTQLQRLRTEQETILQSRDLSIEHCKAFLSEMTTTLTTFLSMLQADKLIVGRHISQSGESAQALIKRVVTSIETAITTQALSPAVK
ncbi:hypothetical protein [Lacunimicrobium album]